MFHHGKKICYVAYPKTASTSLRSFLIKLGFTKPIGINGHASVIDILKTGDYSDYVFFTVYRNPTEHFLSSYKHVMNLWKGKILNSHIEIKNINEYINYLENEWHRHQYNFKNFLCDSSGKLRINLFLNMNNLSDDINKFCRYFSFPQLPFPHLNKQPQNETIILTNEQKNRIEKLYSRTNTYVIKK